MAHSSLPSLKLLLVLFVCYSRLGQGLPKFNEQGTRDEMQTGTMQSSNRNFVRKARLPETSRETYPNRIPRAQSNKSNASKNKREKPKYRHPLELAVQKPRRNRQGLVEEVQVQRERESTAILDEAETHPTLQWGYFRHFIVFIESPH